MIDSFNKGILYLEVNIKEPEKFINLLWHKGILVKNIVKLNVTTIRFKVFYEDYPIVKELVINKNGKVKILKKQGNIFLIKRFLNMRALLMGGLLFVGILYYLSTYVWSIEIKTGENISPYEIRENLLKLNITPGMKKNNIDVYKLEDDLEGVNKNILWMRARIEGSTLKIIIEEKVNPPKLTDDESNNIIAKRNGEIKRLFVSSGTALVERGDIVKEGDLLIQGVQGKEDGQYNVPAVGVVLANTFYEREMEMQIGGEELASTGEEDKDIYISILGKKIYLKKAINKYEYYDKIEEKDSFIKIVKYCEKKYKSIDIPREEAVEKAKKELKESLLKNLDNDAIVIKENANVMNLDSNKIRVSVVFLVEENIAEGK
ncbi:MAG: sporulation protein YqfD [Clostridiales bacterium]|nr:sporulation protein YqfD [Clostridiales bacterium]